MWTLRSKSKSVDIKLNFHVKLLNFDLNSSTQNSTKTLRKSQIGNFTSLTKMKSLLGYFTLTFKFNYFCSHLRKFEFRIFYRICFAKFQQTRKYRIYSGLNSNMKKNISSFWNSKPENPEIKSFRIAFFHSVCHFPFFPSV